MTDAMKQRAVLGYFRKFWNATVVNPILELIGDEKRDREQARKFKERANERETELSERQKEREARRNKLAAKRGYATQGGQTPKQQQQNLNMVRDPNGPGGDEDDDDGPFDKKVIIGLLVFLVIAIGLFVIIPTGGEESGGGQDLAQEKAASSVGGKKQPSFLVLIFRKIFNARKNNHNESAYKLPLPPRALPNLCSSKYITTNGQQDCQARCEVAECCTYPANLALSCSQNNQKTCATYQKYCKILNSSSSKQQQQPKDAQSVSNGNPPIPPPPQNLDEICSNGYLQTSHGHQFCLAACRPATCCFSNVDNQAVDNCPEESCDQYSPCKVLEDMNSDRQDDVNDVEEDNSDGSRHRRTATPSLPKLNSIIYASSAKTTSAKNNETRKSPGISNTELNVLPWKRVTSRDGDSYYVGYLEFCSDGDATFGYRAVVSPSSSFVHDKDHDSTACGMIPSPLVRMIPGETYKLILINNAHVPTNLHTHGLHISGSVGYADDMTRNVDPGKCLSYQYHILDTADVGTFWYHPHRHPFATVQVEGGAYGMLIVDETEETMVSYPKHLQEFFRNEVTLQFSSFMDGGRRINSVNGRTSSTVINLSQDEYYYFRISAVTIEDPINYVEFSSNCETRVVAYDGVYRSKVPHEDVSTRHMLTSSSRIDLAVKCQPNKNTSEDSFILFHQGQDEKDQMEAIVNIRTAKRNVGDASATASPFWDSVSLSQWSPKRPYYMPDLTVANQVDDTWDLHMQNKTVLKGDSSSAEKEKMVMKVSMNDHTWDVDNPVRTFELNQLIELNLWNTRFHPFHIHINRMQIVEPGGCGDGYEEGEYYDTIAAAAATTPVFRGKQDTKCAVRMKFFDFAGRIVAHCHKLNHEDKGMMIWIDVKDGDGHNLQGKPQEECMNAEILS